MIATPEGKLCAFFWHSVHATDLRLSLVEPGHKIGSPVYYVLILLPVRSAAGKYTVAIYKVLKLAGGGTLLCLPWARLLPGSLGLRSENSTRSSRKQSAAEDWANCWVHEAFASMRSKKPCTMYSSSG